MDWTGLDMSGLVQCCKILGEWNFVLSKKMGFLQSKELFNSLPSFSTSAYFMSKNCGSGRYRISTKSFKTCLVFWELGLVASRVYVCVLVARVWLWDPTRLLCPWNLSGKNTGVGSYFLLQGIFPIRGSNPGLPHCWQIFYHLSHQGNLQGRDPRMWPDRNENYTPSVDRHSWT